MQNILRFELKRAFCNRNFMISLIIGLVIVSSHLILNVLPSVGSLDNYLLGKGEYPLSLFNTWTGGEGRSIQPSLFNMLIPFLAAIPFMNSYYVDNKSGYVKNIFMKVEKKKYFIAKFISVFLSSGIVVILPLLIDLLLTAMFMPALIPDASSMTFSLNASCMLSGLFYQQPFLYLLVYFFIFFMYAGLLGVLGLTISFFVNNSLFVILSPFMLYILVDYVFFYLGASKFSIRVFLRMDQPHAVIGINVLIVYIVISLALVITYIFKGKKYEAI